MMKLVYFSLNATDKWSKREDAHTAKPVWCVRQSLNLDHLEWYQWRQNVLQWAEYLAPNRRGDEVVEDSPTWRRVRRWSGLPCLSLPRVKMKAPLHISCSSLLSDIHQNTNVSKNSVKISIRFHETPLTGAHAVTCYNNLQEGAFTLSCPNLRTREFR
jgi:hypothetical protein